MCSKTLHGTDSDILAVHCKNKTANMTNLLVNTVASNSGNC